MPRACLVNGCPNIYFRHPGTAIHIFPEDLVQRRIWTVRTGSVCDDQRLKSGGICSYHFSEQNYKNLEGVGKKKALLKYAVPDLNLPGINSDGVVFNCDQVTGLVFGLLGKEIEIQKLKTEIQKSQENLSTEKKINVTHQVQLNANEKELEKLNKNVEKQFQGRVTAAFKDVFTANQVDLILNKLKYKRWVNEDMSKAIAIYNCSSSCYVYLREQLNYPLPSKRSVLRWSSRIHVYPGLINPVFVVMKDEMKDFTSMQKQAVLCFDEVSIDSRVSLEKKHQIILGPCKNMMAIYARGLFSSWKQIVYFDFDLRLTKEIIFRIINALYEVGVNIVGVISDMCTINVRVWNELGIDINKGVYCFQHPNSGANVWMFADFIHLIKLLRNHFIDHPIKLGPDFNNEIIDRATIEEILAAQKDDLQITFKLTRKHLDMNKRERMNVRSAKR